MMSFISNLGLPLAKKWIAGTSVHDALLAAAEINKNGEKAIINYLGENYESKDQVVRVMTVYEDVMSKVQQQGVDADISAKPSQLGLRISNRLFLKNYMQLAELAKRKNLFLWLDMEESGYVEHTIRAYLKARRRFDNVGICIQANLKRSYKDVARIVGGGGIIRLVKGAYKESDRVAFNKAEERNRNYVRLMEYLFDHSPKFMIATHDEKMIDKAIELNRARRRRLMFGMLRGIRPKLALKLAEKGYAVYIYVPFGREWVAYSIRRLREAGHAKLVFRSLLQG